MTLSNEYEKMLKYLESQNLNKASPPARSGIKFEAVDTLKLAREKARAKSESKKKTKQQEVSEATKKLIEESKIDDYIDLPHSHGKHLPSKGFSVSQFESLMRSKLIEEYKTRQSYERPYISCSELYNCMRQNYYVRKRYQVDISAQYRFSYLYLIQKVGNVIHDIFQELYNFTEVEKTIVSEKYKVKGRIDAIKERTLYEIKSIDSNKYKGKYIKDHYLQGVIYSYILIHEYDYEIDNITIIYVDRNLKNIHVFDLDVDEKVAESLLQRAPILLRALESNKIPEPVGSTKEQCQYCPYKKYCKKDGYNKLVPAFLQMEVKKETDKKEKSVFLM
jgi:CRISPR/Cas system-associated exonuclease Cas4 (RecB family)